MKIIIILSSTLIAISATAQSLPENDSTTKLLEGVIVTSYSNNIKLIDVPAPVAFVTPRILARFDNTSVLSAINTQPGVRMEERSPGSYRLNIRGSSLRSPFGVRNVKVYYNGIPFTDPGGNTYFNQLGFYSFNSIEIIKGPAGSMYGAGTGGAMIINNIDPLQPSFTAAFTGGSYHQNSMNGSITFGKEDLKNTISYQHQSGNGYRDHTEMYR
ncbi:MAG: Plug domain-containing protein, partial [Ginsengibacter sp.]